MRKLFLLSLFILTGLWSFVTAAVEYNWQEIYTRVNRQLYNNRVALNQEVVNDVISYLDTVDARSDGQKISIIRGRVWAYDQTTGADRSLAGLRAFAEPLIAAAKLEKAPTGAQLASIFSIWYRQTDVEFAKEVYDFIKQTPGAEGYADSGLWANAVGKYEEAYSLYVATAVWPHRAVNLAIYKLNDPVKAFAAARLLTGKTYRANIVKPVIQQVVSKLVGNDAIPAAEMKTFLQNVNRKYSSQLIEDKAPWEPIIAQIRTVLETY